MANTYEPVEIQSPVTPLISLEEVKQVVAEIDRLERYIADYKLTVSQKLDEVESNRVQLEAENARLLSAKALAYVERDVCIGLIAQLAQTNGLKVGVAPENQIVLDLPSGQVSWAFNDSEAHLFSTLPEYTGKVETLEISEKYHRVMNPGFTLDLLGLQDSGQSSPSP